MNHNNPVKITLIIAGAIVIIAILAFIYFSQSNFSKTISTTGLSSLSVVPDKIAVYFNIETEGKTATEARDKNSEISDNLITEIIKLGFERKDIQTQNYNVYPKYEWKNNQRVDDGFQAINSLKVEFSSEEKDKIGNVIDAGVDSGALISYINFELSQELENEYKAEAIKLATEDAKNKAEAIAEGVGKNLGRLVSISSQDFDYSPWRVYDSIGAEAMGEDINEAAKAATTSIQPSERDVNARVSVTYKI